MKFIIGKLSGYLTAEVQTHVRQMSMLIQDWDWMKGATGKEQGEGA